MRFLEELLITHDGKLNIEIFDSTVAKIREGAPLISKVLTRWFLSGKPELCMAIYEIVGTSPGHDLRIEVDRAELNPADYIHTLFIARKAIGFFFMKPITAASVVLSLMHHAQDIETLEALGELMLDPLLLNYPGDMRSYVKQQAEHESDNVKKTIDNALSSIEQYLETLRALPELPALHVGLSQHESYRRRMSESMAESMKEAEKKSIFFNLFSRSTLLYGNKFINYVYAGDGKPQRMETPLTSHSFSMDYPRMDNIDPYGLDYILRVFRQEQFRT